MMCPFGPQFASLFVCLCMSSCLVAAGHTQAELIMISMFCLCGYMASEYLDNMRHVLLLMQEAEFQAPSWSAIHSACTTPKFAPASPGV